MTMTNRADELLRELLEALDQSADASEHADDVAAMLRYGEAEKAARAYLNEKPHERGFGCDLTSGDASPTHAAAEPEKPMNETGGDAPDAITTLRAENERLRGAILWALGYYDFPERKPGQGAYWWRIELARRAAIPSGSNAAAETPLYASPSAQPKEVTDEDVDEFLARAHSWQWSDRDYAYALLSARAALKSAGKEST